MFPVALPFILARRKQASSPGPDWQLKHARSRRRRGWPRVPLRPLFLLPGADIDKILVSPPPAALCSQAADAAAGENPMRAAAAQQKSEACAAAGAHLHGTHTTAMAGLSLGAAEESTAEVRTQPHSTRLPWNAH